MIDNNKGPDIPESSAAETAVNTWPPDMVQPLANATSEGIMEALKSFINHNRIDITPGTLSTFPPTGFMILLTSEIAIAAGEKAEATYPFKQSFKAIWDHVNVELTPIFCALWENKEGRVAVALARTVAFGETLKFLEANRDDVAAEFAKIRGQDLPEEEKK